MEQKTLLINSMEKLINHIVVSRKNQQEIFASLSRNDFKKIISNLEDQTLRLRKISLALISHLLYNNHTLKEKFCHIMNIPLVPGRIALNSKLCASNGRPKSTTVLDMNNNIKEVFTILKQPISESEKQSLFWFINFDGRGQGNLQLEYINTPNPQNININELLDPLECMIGFVLPQRNHQRLIDHPQVQVPIVGDGRRGKSQYEPNSATLHPNAGNGRMLNNYFKPNLYKPEHFKYGGGSNLNQSLKINPPGYSTDRQMLGKGQGTGIKAVNTSVYQQSAPMYPQTAQDGTSPLHQYKHTPVDLDNMNRTKYTGIKLISNSTTAKNRQTGKYFQDNPMFVPQSVSNSGGTKMAGQFINSSGKTVNLGQRNERGYQTLRQKKIIQKYPI